MTKEKLLLFDNNIQFICEALCLKLELVTFMKSHRSLQVNLIESEVKSGGRERQTLMNEVK